MKLYVAVPSKNPEWNYSAVAAAADGVILMNYDEHYPGGQPGPVASQDWFVDNLESALKVVPKDKLICAIANFGYDWAQRDQQGKLPPGEKDQNQTVQQAWIAARDSEQEVEFDEDYLVPHVSYLDEQNVQHDIWFQDAVTAWNEMRASQELGIRPSHCGDWARKTARYGGFGTLPVRPAAPDKLKDVPPGQDVDMEGEGEILRIEARPANGVRSIVMDKVTGLIGDETYETLAEPYRVGRYGASPNEMAITFDDGPDPDWTPKILNVLNEKMRRLLFS